MGGEKMGVGCPEYILLGSPPRMRGKDVHDADAVEHTGITPARAGKRCRRRSILSVSRDHPRVGGEKLLEP